MSGRRFGKGKGKRSDKSGPKKFDPSPLIGDVDLSRKNIKLYLVKMPGSLAKQFDDPSKGVVGRLRFADLKQEKKEPVPVDPTHRIEANDDPFEPGTQMLDTSVEKLHQIPDGFIFLDRGLAQSKQSQDKLYKKYKILRHHTNTEIAVFSSNTDSVKDDTRVEGIVESNFQVSPVMTGAYRLSNKLPSSTKSSRPGIRVMTQGEMHKADLKALRLSSMNETIKEHEERKRQKEESRRHLDIPDEKWREHVRSEIFQAFESNPYYTADQLARAIGDTTTRIRPIITEICQYNKSAPFAAHYELKDEFKTVKQREQKIRAIEEFRQAQLENQRKRKEDREREREKGDSSQSKKARLQ